MSDSYEEVSYEEVYESASEYEEEYEYEVEYESASGSDDGSDDSSSDWSDSSSEEEEDVEIDADAFAGLSKYEIALIKWGKREEDETKPKKVKEKKEKKEKKKKKLATEDEQKGGVKKVAFDPMAEHSADDLYKIVDAFSAPKGRKAFGDIEVLSSLEPILKYATRFNAGTQMEIMSLVFCLRWNLKRRGAFESVEDSVLEASIDVLERMFVLYAPNQDADPSELYCELKEALEHDDLDKRLWSLFRTLAFGCEQLDTEILKGFKLNGPDTTTEAYTRLFGYQTQLLSLMWRIISLALRRQNEAPEYAESITELLVRFAYHTHYLGTEQFNATMDKIRKTAPTLPKPDFAYELIQSMVRYVHRPTPVSFTEGELKQRLKHQIWLKLMLVFSYASADLYQKALSLLRGADLYDQLNGLNDTDLSIFMNRAVVSCGLAAFRIGKVNEAHSFLQEICSFSKHRELLAQSIPRQGLVKDEDQERQERKRLLPAHMHILSETIEVAHNVSAMLIIAPLMARQTHTNLHALRSVNRHFVHMYDMYSKSLVTTTPESPRDVVMFCLNNVVDGLWQDVCNTLATLDEISIETLKPEIAKTALRCFVSKYASFYKSIIIDDLVERFELSTRDVTAQVAHLLASRHISGNLHNGVLNLDVDEPDVIRHHKSFTEKISAVMDSNEALFAFKRQ